VQKSRLQDSSKAESSPHNGACSIPSEPPTVNHLVKYHVQTSRPQVCRSGDPLVREQSTQLSRTWPYPSASGSRPSEASASTWANLTLNGAQLATSNAHDVLLAWPGVSRPSHMPMAVINPTMINLRPGTVPSPPIIDHLPTPAVHAPYQHLHSYLPCDAKPTKLAHPPPATAAAPSVDLPPHKRPRRMPDAHPTNPASLLPTAPPQPPRSSRRHTYDRHPRALNLAGDESDDSNLLQLRGAIHDEPSTGTRSCDNCLRRVTPAAGARSSGGMTAAHAIERAAVAAAVAAAMQEANAENDEANSGGDSSSLENERLEDSLIGNDVLVEESRQQSKQLRALFEPVLGTDRCGFMTSHRSSYIELDLA
jgi:hypothetical protein